MTTLRIRALSNFLVVLFATGLTSCALAEEEVCGNQAAIWFHQVVEAAACNNCVEFELSTPVFNLRSVRVHVKPDFVLDRCDVVDVELHSNAVTLKLSKTSRQGIASAIERWLMPENGQLVAIRLAGSASLVSVQNAEDLGWFLTFFDFASEMSADDFVAQLGAEASANKTGLTVIDSSVDGESPAAKEARKFLEKAKLEDTVYDELRESLENGEDEDAIKGILKRLDESSHGDPRTP